MGLEVPNVGETALLSRGLNKAATGDVKIGLYSDNITYAETAVIGDYTVITTADEGTYQTLTGANWTVTDGVGSYAQQTFTYTGTEASVYGYVVTDAAGTTLLWTEVFSDGPYAIPSGGGTIKVTPTITMS